MWNRYIEIERQFDQLRVESQLFAEIKGTVRADHIVGQIYFLDSPLSQIEIPESVSQCYSTLILDLVLVQI